MGLENYSKRQKYFMGALVIGLAAMFTVSGAMLAILGGGEAMPDAGEFNGKEVRLMKFSRTKRVLGIVRALDSRAAQNKKIYGHLPTLALRAQQDSSQVQERSLLTIWPEYQDQWAWCHMALADEAKKEGMSAPSNRAIRDDLLAKMNEGSKPLEQIVAKDFSKEFKARYGLDIEEALPVLRECFMIGDYVEALVADLHTELKTSSTINSGNQEEVAAVVVRIKIDEFLEQAVAEVRRENFEARTARATSGLGVSSLSAGFDEFERAYNDNKGQHLNSEATFSFDLIEAYVVGFEAPFEEDRARLIYMAVRDEMFRANEALKKDIDGRLKIEEGNVSGDADKSKWKEEQWKTWRKETSEVMAKYETYREASPKLNKFLQRQNSMLAVQSSLSILLAELEEFKQARTREFDAEATVLRNRQGIHSALKAYLETLRKKFDSIRDAGNRRIQELGTNHSDLSDDTKITSLVNDFLSKLRSLDHSSLAGLVNDAKASSYRYERSRDNAKADLEDFHAELKKNSRKNDGTEMLDENGMAIPPEEGTAILTDDGKEMSEAEITSRIEQLEIKVEEHEKKIKKRDEKLKLVEAFAEEFHSFLASAQLAVSAAKSGDVELRRQVIRALIQDLPLQISSILDKARDEIVPENEIDREKEAYELIAADITAQNNSRIKDAESTLDAGISDKCIRLKLSLIDGLPKNMTWEDVVSKDKLSYLQNVDGAKEFLEGANNHAGKMSEVLAVPGKGYILIRLTKKTSKYAQGREDAKDRIIKLATIRRARELTANAMEELRRDIVENGWDAAVGRATAKYGTNLTQFETDYFVDNEDLPGIWSTNDRDFLLSTSSPSANSPDAPFISRIKQIKASEGVTEIIGEMKLSDPLRRPDREEWAYMLARVKDRRIVVRRMEVTAMDETGRGSPAKVWRDRHIASGKVVRRLTQPSELLDTEEYEIVRYKQPSEKDDKDKEESEE